MNPPLLLATRCHPPHSLHNLGFGAVCLPNTVRLAGGQASRLSGKTGVPPVGAGADRRDALSSLTVWKPVFLSRGTKLAGLACLPAALAILALPAAAQIAAWDFTGENTQASSVAEVFDGKLDSATTVTRGSGAAASAANNSFRTTGFGNNGIATANTDYFQVTLSAVVGYTLSLGTIDARFNGTDTFRASPGGVTGQFAYSLDGATFFLIESPFGMTTTGAMPQLDVSGIPALQNVPDATTLTLRYYASGQTSSGGWGFYSVAAGDYGLAIGGTLAPSVLPTLTLTTSLSIFAENAPAPAAIGTVAIPSALAADLVVTLACADPSEATVPATVTLTAGSTSATFDITAVDDALADGPQTFNLTASATAYTSAVQSITVNDDGDASPNLSPGAIAFVGFNADGNDDLAFVALESIAANETIYFCDKPWNGLELGKGGAFGVEEGIISWTSPAGGVAAGTVVALSSLVNGNRASSAGTVTPVSGTFNLSGDGETVYAYLGSALAPTGFLAAIATQTSDPVAGTGLSPAQVVYLTHHADVAAYTGARGDKASYADYLTAIGTPTNWLTEDGAGNQHSNSIAPDVPFATQAFTLTTSAGYAAWARDNADNEAANVDTDGDGVPNGVEYFMGEPHATFTPTPAVTNSKITWPHHAGANATYTIKTSTDLSHWESATVGVKDNGDSIEFTLPNGATRIFVRLEVVTSP
ncbi:MAG: hypothetical protein WCP45_03130 [Verrucomicrobiota bacterium]